MLKDVAERLREGVLKVSTSMLPGESENRDILTHMLQTNPSQIPLVLLHIQFERLILQAMDKLRKDLEVSIKQMEGTIYDDK